VIADHVITPASAEAATVTLRIDFDGWLSWLIAMMAGGLTSDYLMREAASLKATVEASRPRASHA
jgi:hypothetical protein